MKSPLFKRLYETTYPGDIDTDYVDHGETNGTQETN